MDYPFFVRPLSDEDGGGYLAEAYDLKGCMADGETIEEACLNLQDAIQSWIKTAKEHNLSIPSPTHYTSLSDKLIIDTPKILRQHLTELADREGISLDVLTVGLLSDTLDGRKSQDSKKTRATS